MAVYVDPIYDDFPVSPCLWEESCHLFADTLEELNEVCSGYTGIPHA